MKKKIFASIALLALLTACDDHYDDQFNINPGITDVKDIAMTLETSDYGSISKLTANQELALSKDPEGKTFVKALEAVGTNHYFTEEAPAEDYVPAYLKSKYLNADAGSKFVVTYKLFSPSDYMDDFKKLSTYDLTEEDYKTVWGESVKASFLSPSTIGKIQGVLSNAVKNPVEGEMKVVNYAYSATEPSIGGGGETAPTYTSIADAIKGGAGNYDIKGTVSATNARSFLVKDETGIIMVYLNAFPPYSLGDEIAVSGEISSYKGAPLQFSKEAKITMLKPASAFAYPSNPEFLDGAGLSAAVGKTDVKYVTYEGTLTSSTNNGNVYYNVKVEGAASGVQGSIQYPLSLDPALIDQKVKVTGYLVGQSSTSKYINTMATSVVLADGSGTNLTAAGVVAVSPAGNYTVQGVVVGTYTKGFVLSDATGYAWVYQGDNPSVVVGVGDIVMVSGDTSKNTGLMQFGPSSMVVKGATSTAAKGLNPFEMSAADLDAYVDAERKYISYVSYQGKLIKSGNYYNVEIEGASKAIGSIKFPADDLVTALVDKKVVVKGLLLGVSSGKYVNTMAVSIEEATATRSLAATRATTVSPTASALYVYDGENKTWKPYTLKEAKLLVAEPALYESLGADMIEKPEAVLPTYLKQKYPYAAVGDMVAVVYNKKADTPVVAEYTLGEDWTETTSCKLVTATFTQDAEGISVEASMYLNETFKTDKGSFTIQDVFLEGVKWVWSKSSYDGKDFMKASAYIKATGNNPAESWLVSPVMNFKKSKAPELLFEHACRFRTETPSDNLNVMVSTDYSDDVKTATWTALTVENWPEDNSQYPFASNKIDLSAYNGQKVTIAFKYVSTKDVAPTWEVANVVVREKVTEGEGEEGGDAETPAE